MDDGERSMMDDLREIIQSVMKRQEERRRATHMVHFFPSYTIELLQEAFARHDELGTPEPEPSFVFAVEHRCESPPLHVLCAAKLAEWCVSSKKSASGVILVIEMATGEMLMGTTVDTRDSPSA